MVGVWTGLRRRGFNGEKNPQARGSGRERQEVVTSFALRRKVGPSATGLVARGGGKPSRTLHANLHHRITSFMQLKVNQFQEWSCFESILFG